MVRLTNRTMSPLFLGRRMRSCGLGPLFTVADASGTTLQDPPFCASSCQNIAQGSLVECPPLPCIVNSVRKLQPDESTSQQWNGVYWLDTTLPAECAPTGANIECGQSLAVQPGSFTFTAMAGTGIDCSEFGDNTCTECMPDANGGCTTYGAVVAGRLLPTATSVTLDASYGVPASSAVPRPVELVFEE